MKECASINVIIRLKRNIQYLYSSDVVQQALYNFNSRVGIQFEHSTKLVPF